MFPEKKTNSTDVHFCEFPQLTHDTVLHNCELSALNLIIKVKNYLIIVYFSSIVDNLHRIRKPTFVNYYRARSYTICFSILVDFQHISLSNVVIIQSPSGELSLAKSFKFVDFIIFSIGQRV